MERITEHIDYCFLACYERQDDKIREECPIYKCCYSRQMHEKLSHFEDLEEQGRLICLPCKVGDYIYRISNDGLCVYKTKVIRFEIYTDCTWVRTLTDLGIPEMGVIGIDLFLTKEEAEAKLEELKEGAE